MLLFNQFLSQTLEVYNTVRRETLTVGKFGEFVTKLILVDENLANLPILRLKIKLYSKTPA